VKQRHRLHDRRAATRPANGDSAPCPSCKTGTLEFNERYRIALVTDRTVVLPAWICDRPLCRYWHPVRSGDPALTLHRAAAALSAKSNRQLMKAHSTLDRAQRTLMESLDRKKRRRS
jgi:hypothetical protein